MRKIYYTIGSICPHLYAKFDITLKNRLNEFCIQDTRTGELSIRNLYPSFSLIMTDEVKDSSSKWSLDKSVNFSRFTGKSFVSRAREFLKEYLEKDLFKYSNGVLLINQSLANKISFVVTAEFEKQVMVKPVKGKDKGTGQQFEGVAIFFHNISNYVVVTYDEFESLVNYMDGIDYDGLALKLLTLAITIYGLDEMKSGDIVVGSTSSDVVNWVDKPKVIPDFK